MRSPIPICVVLCSWKYFSIDKARFMWYNRLHRTDVLCIYKEVNSNEENEREGVWFRIFEWI